jgi:hypothetical protein
MKVVEPSSLSRLVVTGKLPPPLERERGARGTSETDVGFVLAEEIATDENVDGIREWESPKGGEEGSCGGECDGCAIEGRHGCVGAIVRHGDGQRRRW